MAQKSGVTVERIAEIERGGSVPTVQELVGISVALGVSSDVLVGLKLPATVTVGRTTVTVGVRIEGSFSDDRTVLETTKQCVKAIEAALSPSPPPPPVEVRVPARAYSDLRSEVKAAEARVKAAETELVKERIAGDEMRRQLRALRTEVARLRSEADEAPR